MSRKPRKPNFTPPDRRPVPAGLEDAIDVALFLSEQSYTPATDESYRLILARFAEYLDAKQLPLEGLTAQDFNAYIAQGRSERTGLPWSKNYAYIQQGALRAYVKWAVERGTLTAPPPFMHKKALPRELPMGLRAVTLDEIRKVADFLIARRNWRAHRRTLAMLLLSFDAGLRASEVCGLTMRQIDLDARRVIVRRKRGSISSNGFSPITAWAVAEWLNDRGGMDLPTGELRIFVTDEGKAINRQAWRLVCFRLAKAAGVPHFAPHALRRGTAIRYREQGAPVTDVLARMGWNGPGGMKLYEHYSQLFCADPLEQYMPTAGLEIPAEVEQ